MKSMLLLAILFAFLGCSSSYTYVSKLPSAETKKPILQQLSDRHLKFWELFSEKRFDDTYTIELPHLQFQKSLEWYHDFYSTNNKGYTVSQVAIKEVDDNRAIVITRSQTKGGLITEFEDRWVLVDQKWYHYFEFSKLPSPDKPF